MKPQPSAWSGRRRGQSERRTAISARHASTRRHGGMYARSSHPTASGDTIANGNSNSDSKGDTNMDPDTCTHALRWERHADTGGLYCSDCGVSLTVSKPHTNVGTRNANSVPLCAGTGRRRLRVAHRTNASDDPGPAYPNPGGCSPLGDL